MNETDDAKPTHALRWGTGYCLLAALCYTGANICLRHLAGLQMHPAWVNCVKETVSVAVVGPLLLWQFCQGVRYPVRTRTVFVLLVTAIGVQMIGSLGVQWSYGVTGLAVSVPVVFGTMLATGAVLGVFLFGESLSFRSVLATGTVIASVALLCFGASGSSDSVMAAALSPSILTTLLAIAAAAVGGITFACLGAAIRLAAKTQVSILITVFVVTGVGVVLLGSLSLMRLGFGEMLATDPQVMAWMLAAGSCNLLGFLSIAKGLQLTTLVHANVLNASQVALGAAAGIFFFREPHSPALVCGVILTIAALLLNAPGAKTGRN
ncbi:MAG: hypothetical protein FJ276_32620 [Planctomycetes bacterium]|nr:hypothetical protein [Planctomycetota bacterium]